MLSSLFSPHFGSQNPAARFDPGLSLPRRGECFSPNAVAGNPTTLSRQAIKLI